VLLEPGDCVTGNPRAVQAAKPPSSTATRAWPSSFISHQKRAAAIAPSPAS
jgi:hypothetical protein